jgi:hypothetical protein
MSIMKGFFQSMAVMLALLGAALAATPVAASAASVFSVHKITTPASFAPPSGHVSPVVSMNVELRCTSLRPSFTIVAMPAVVHDVSVASVFVASRVRRTVDLTRSHDVDQLKRTDTARHASTARHAPHMAYSPRARRT